MALCEINCEPAPHLYGHFTAGATRYWTGRTCFRANDTGEPGFEGRVKPPVAAAYTLRLILSCCRTVVLASHTNTYLSCDIPAPSFLLITAERCQSACVIHFQRRRVGVKLVLLWGTISCLLKCVKSSAYTVTCFMLRCHDGLGQALHGISRFAGYR